MSSIVQLGVGQFPKHCIGGLKMENTFSLISQHIPKLDLNFKRIFTLPTFLTF
jgi:hypothetical protein